MLTDSNTHMIDASAVGVAIATLFGWLPNIAALLTVIWMVLRVYETYLNVQALRKQNRVASKTADLVKTINEQVKKGDDPNVK